jgi:hypothetical protein
MTTTEDGVADSDRTQIEPTKELALRPIMPLDSVRDGQAQMQAFQDECRGVLSNTDWQGTPGARGSFVKKSGWRKLALRYGVSTAIVLRTVEHAEDGAPLRAETVVRATHLATGQFSEADGYCSADEPRFKEARGRLKLENDLRNTATTRAKSRAISDLIGFGMVSAEEMSAGAPDAPAPFGDPAGDTLSDTVDRVLLWVTSDDVAAATWLRDAIQSVTGDYLARASALAVATLGAKLKAGGARIEWPGEARVPEPDVVADEPDDDEDPDDGEPVEAEVVDPGAPTDL